MRHLALGALATIAAALGGMFAVMAWDASREQDALGRVHFAISCSAESQRLFDAATARLHTLSFRESERLYAAIAETEPDCAMAYWGIAMSRLKRPIAGIPVLDDIRAGRAAVRAGAPARIAEPRERAYLAAVGLLFREDGPADWHERAVAYEQAMAAIAAQYEEDREATIFYALALNMAASASDQTFQKQTKAAELLLAALAEQPQHPGLVHYLTYCLTLPANAAPELKAAQQPTPAATMQTALGGDRAGRRRGLLRGHAAGLVRIADGLVQMALQRPASAAPETLGAWRKRRMRLAGLAALLLLIPAGALLVLEASPRPGPAAISKSIGGPFKLTAGDGRTVTERSFPGKWLLVYFGYTQCPDVCPTTFAEITQTLDRLGPLAAEVQPLFIAIDPERDTAQTVGAYVKAFDPRIVGLTGSSREIAAAARQYRVHYAKKAPADAASDAYLMEHTAFVYVMAPDGRYVTLFAPLGGQGPDHMASRLRELMTGAGSR